jgi:hypothetical protein
MSITDARIRKSLWPRYRSAQARYRKRLVDAVFHLAFVVRENIGRKCKRGTIPSIATQRLDKIREAIARVDEIKKEKP